MDTSAIAAKVNTRVVSLVIGSTLLLTMAFLGVVAFLSGNMENSVSRLPFYVLGASILFVVLLFTFERREFDGRLVFLSTVALAVLGLVVLFLAGEGAVYVVTYPGQILASRLLVYLISAGIVCTGVVYWGLSHWREFVSV